MIVSIFRKSPLLALLPGIVVASSLAVANAAQPEVGKDASFDAIAPVFTHPRCMNCHQLDAPRQSDTQIPHQQQIVRGPNDRGVPALQCNACHQTNNVANGFVPGAKGWQLAPLSMNWEGLSKRQICLQMKDPARNGGRHTGEEVIEHMRQDAIVLWAWNPGAGRTVPPISHDEFVRRLEAWRDAGMPCP